MSSLPELVSDDEPKGTVLVKRPVMRIELVPNAATAWLRVAAPVPPTPTAHTHSPEVLILATKASVNPTLDIEIGDADPETGENDAVPPLK